MDLIDFPTDRRHHSEPTVALRGSAGTSSRASSRQPGSTCLHERSVVGPYVLDVCPTSGEAVWLDDGETIDPAEALARLFGNFDLAAMAPGLDTPGESVLVYTPDGRRGRGAMRALPPHRWIEGAPGLWLTHDGERLLMSPVDRLLTERLTRDL